MTSKLDQEKAPGTLSSQDVADEFRAFKDKLLGVPATLTDMAKKASGVETGNAEKVETSTEDRKATDQTVAQPNEILERLSAIESRLTSLESSVIEIRDHLIKK